MARIISGGGGKLLTTALNPWYRAGGAPPPIAVWQPKAGNGWAPANLAGSYVNRVNPGTYDAAPGTAPAWAAATGWTFVTASSQFLTTGLVPANGYSMLVRFNSAPTVAATLALCGIGIGVANKRFAIYSALLGADDHVYGYGNSSTSTGIRLASGTMGITVTNYYLDGVIDGIPGTWVNTTAGILLGAVNSADPGPTAASFFGGVITAAAVWSVDVAAYMAALHAALVTAGL